MSAKKTKGKKSKKKNTNSETVAVTSETNTRPVYEQAGFRRRLAALIYDFVLNVGIWMTVTGLYITAFVAIADSPPQESPILQFTLFPILLGSTFLFYYWFWTHGGKTLGMQAWHIRAVTEEGEPLSFADCVRRTCFGFPLVWAGGLGLIWVILDKDNTALHDHLSKTRVVHIPKEKKKKK